ncbi:MAG TPA: SH3 domain-containing protein [Paracoccus sp. (in: a-proteobacteria)]|uniref:COG3650 family protein n=1 Tax=Paracoccus sp. TaxID=267 RepID=UPI002CB91BB9|nr:SH3 domain-containing protein [Paracoccus sp. (in: a-proteobacteria)]HWL55643.1 SH3 domain-containing protein [Paracoccus sp. (in: a-proteobacteria)]
MLRVLLTGFALTLPLAAGAQDKAVEPAPAAAPEGDEAAKAPETPRPAPLVAPPPAPAKPDGFLPNLFDVTVVETWETLNVREKPDGQAKVIATLPATAKGVEVVARDSSGKWGRVNAGERSGWVALRFLAEQKGVWQPASLPQSLACHGTEPFWGLKTTRSGMVFSEPDAGDRALELRKVMDRGIEGEPTRGLIAGDGKGRVTAFIRPAQCSDGMSDRGFALAVSVILDGAETPSRMLTGCCSIAR